MKRGKKREMYVTGWENHPYVDGDWGYDLLVRQCPPLAKDIRKMYAGSTPGDIINVYRLVVCERYKVLANGEVERLTKPGREGKRG